MGSNHIWNDEENPLRNMSSDEIIKAFNANNESSSQEAREAFNAARQMADTDHVGEHPYLRKYENYDDYVALKELPHPAQQSATEGVEAKHIAMNIVNQILDLSGASVEKRQSINDTCDDFAEKLISAYSNQQNERLKKALRDIVEYYDQSPAPSPTKVMLIAEQALK